MIPPPASAEEQLAIRIRGMNPDKPSDEMSSIPSHTVLPCVTVSTNLPAPIGCQIKQTATSKPAKPAVTKSQPGIEKSRRDKSRPETKNEANLMAITGHEINRQ